MSKCKLIKLSEIAKVTQGQSPESKYYSTSEGIPFMQGNRTFGMKYPIIDTFTTKTTKIAKKNDVLMSVRAPVGDLNIATCDLCIGRGLSAITSKKNNNEFLYYSLKYNVQNLLRQGSGTTYSSVNKDIINDFDLIVPNDEKSWEAISNLLSSLDSKIELNNKINKELEAMAKTLYDYWFVQFDFPNENGKPYKSSGGKMVYNKELKREIPEGWEVKTISQLIGNNKGGDWGKEEIEGNYTQKVSCIRGADLNGLNGLGELNPPERFILDKNSNKILESHDLIVEISGGSPTQSTGRLSFVIDETITRFESPLICSNFCKSFSLKNPKHFYYFIYMWNNLYDNNVLFGWEGKTSGIKNLLFDSFTQKYFIVVPNESINQKFYEKMNSFHKMKQNNLKENQELAKLRDWLLPMLMNGQVRVK